jgi:hypothetical protein
VGSSIYNPIASTKPQNIQSAKTDDPSRVPSVYLGWAFLQFLFLLPFRRINNLRVFNALGSSIHTAPTNLLHFTAFVLGFDTNHR